MTWANAPKLVLTLGGTPVATNTPGPTNTPTQTPTPGPSPTPTNTFTPTSAPTATQPPPGAFNNATFVYDGDGKRVKSTFIGVTQMTKKKIKINLAPVLTLWAQSVAERPGHKKDVSLTFGKAIAGINV